MGLVEKVESDSSSVDYRARECIGSTRKQLVYCSRAYCLLSSPDVHVYCPLQSERQDGVLLLECLRSAYLAELGSRRPR